MGFDNLKKFLCVSAAALAVAAILVLDCFAAIPKSITVCIDDSNEIKRSSYKTYARTAGQFLEANNIEYDKDSELSCSKNDKITDEMVIKIVLPVDIRVTFDGRTVTCHTTARTAGEAIRENGISVGEDDIIIPGTDEKIRDGDEITVKRVDIRWERSKEKLPYDTITRPGYAVPIGRTRTVSKGSNGIRETTFKVTYIDDKEYTREKIKKETTRRPKDKIIEYGLMIDKTVPSDLSYSRVYRGCRAVSYNYSETRYTASGRRCEYGIAAVDTSVFPFGTRLYISGYGYAVAADRGSSITGTTIDLYFDHRIQCMTWGAQTVDIYVLN